IEGQGWSYVAPPPGGNAITIAAPTGIGNVTIRGVSLNGAGAAGPTNGIVFNSGTGLTVTDCLVQNFSAAGGTFPSAGIGILMQPHTASITFAITNTTIGNTGSAGFSYAPSAGATATANGLIEHVVVENSIDAGIRFNLVGGAGATTVTIANTTSNNNNYG